MGTSKQPKSKINRSFVNIITNYWPFFSIFVVVLIFSSPYFFRGLVPFPSTYLVSFFNPWTNYHGTAVKNNAMPDVITQIYPWKKITIDALKESNLPTWNIYQFAGNPHLANVQSSVFSPWNGLFFVLPFIDAWSILILLQPLLAGMFMYIYVRSIGKSEGASLVAALSFMFSSFVVTWMAYGTLGHALLYLPLFLYGVERILRTNDWLARVILTLSIPLTIFSGHFQTSLYVLIVGVSYLLMSMYRRASKTVVLWSFASVFIGLVIASIQIIPTYQFYAQSARSESFVGEEAIPWNQLIRMIAPDFFGNPVTRNDWVGHYAEWGTYAGVLPFFLALLALFKKVNKYTVFFGIVFLVSILFSFSPFLVKLLASSKIPVLSTSNPSRIVGIIGFCISLLSAFGLDFLVHDWKRRIFPKSTITTFLFGLTTIVFYWVFIFTKNSYFVSSSVENIQVASRNFLIPSVLFVCLLTISIVGYFKWRFTHILLVTVVILLTAFEMIRFSTKWMPFEPKEYVYPPTAPLEFLEKNSAEFRVYGLIGNEVFGMFNLQGIEGYDPLYIKRYGELISAVGDGQVHELSRSVVVFPRNGKYAKDTLDLLGVKYILHSRGDGQGSWLFPFWNYPESYGAPVFSDEKYEIYENKTVYPRAFLVHSYQIKSSPKEVLNAVYSSEIDLRQEVILEEIPILVSNTMQECSESYSDEVKIESYSGSKIVINTLSSCDSILFLSDVYYPGWTAYINDSKVPIYRANYAFRGIPVPKGQHTIVIKYENWYL